MHAWWKVWPPPEMLTLSRIFLARLLRSLHIALCVIADLVAINWAPWWSNMFHDCTICFSFSLSRLERDLILWTWQMLTAGRSTIWTRRTAGSSFSYVQLVCSCLSCLLATSSLDNVDVDAKGQLISADGSPLSKLHMRASRSFRDLVLLAMAVKTTSSPPSDTIHS